MIEIKDDNKYIEDSLYEELLDEQSYTPKEIHDMIENIITDYYEYPGISLAYDEYNSYNEVQDCIDTFIYDDVIPAIKDLGHDCPEDYADIITNLVEDSIDIKQLEDDYHYLVDEQHKERDDEIRSLNTMF